VKHQEANRWKGFVLGLAGGAVGLIAMDSYWQWVAPLVTSWVSNQTSESSGHVEPQPLDSISLIGKQYQEGESSTAALGRIAYRALTGQEAQSQETKTTLSYLVHWIYGMLQGGIYGAIRAAAGFPDIRGGLAFATGLWLFGDELTVPLLGLQGGPTSVPPRQHANRLGAHLAYGFGTAVTTQFLNRLL